MIERFKSDFAVYKLLGDLEDCDIDMVSSGEYAYIRLTSLEKYHRSYMEALFPYCREFELNGQVMK